MKETYNKVRQIITIDIFGYKGAVIADSCGWLQVIDEKNFSSVARSSYHILCQ
jgi:hypothetical protein